MLKKEGNIDSKDLLESLSTGKKGNQLIQNRKVQEGEQEIKKEKEKKSKKVESILEL